MKKWIIFLIINLIAVPMVNAREAPMVFVSFSMPKDALLQWLQQANTVGAHVIIRGLVDNSFQKTAKVIADLIGDRPYGFQIDPTLFTKFSIDKVPAVVIQDESTNQFDVIYGNTSLNYALKKLHEAHQ
jgi:conjugal transfer pilus assembly protein TrbC